MVIYTSVNELPEFPGGMKNFYAFVDKKLKYPVEAGGTKGRVTLTFG
jgi:protein TonB